VVNKRERQGSFYALDGNSSAGEALGDETLKIITQESEKSLKRGFSVEKLDSVNLHSPGACTSRAIQVTSASIEH
jgi:hypothetical protein